MDIRKIIQQEVKKVLSEGVGMSFGYGGLFQDTPDDFDHLKWELDRNQKFYLKELCRVHPNSITEQDFKDASLKLGIPEKNLKSIINTYGGWKPMKETRYDSEAAKASRLTFGNKPASAQDIGLGTDVNKLPVRSSVQMNVPQRKNSRLELYRKSESDRLNRTWYREGEGKEHPSKRVERIYESLTKSLMLYLYAESKPKDINLRHDDKIQIDFEPIINEGNFNQLTGGPNYETEKFKEINSLVEDFNEKFGCSFVIYDHVSGEDYQRIFIEHNVTKQIDMSEDSIAMMKKFLIPRIMMGGKILTNDPSVATLMGLDAGDDTWLYGKIGEPMQSGVLSKHHRGRA